MSNDGNNKSKGMGELIGEKGPMGFWRPSADVAGMLDRLPRATASALKRLGASPFPKTRFPIVGFLETVYEHIGEHARGRLPESK